MNYSGISYYGIVGKVLRFFLKAIPPNAVLPILQGPIRGYKWIAGSHTHGCWLGSYEFEKSKLFIRTVKPGQKIYDIGAHVGYYTLLASKLVGDAGRVFAFEPFPRNIKFLRSHLAMNRIQNVTVVESAVSAVSGQSYLLPGQNSASGKISATGSIQIEIQSLDDFVFTTGHPAPDVVKIDVEGAEGDVIEGARRVIGEYHPVLFIATHSAELHVRVCAELTGVGYELIPAIGGDLAAVDEILAIWQK